MAQIQTKVHEQDVTQTSRRIKRKGYLKQPKEARVKQALVHYPAINAAIMALVGRVEQWLLV